MDYLVVVSGLPGSGKSMIASGLAQRLGLSILSKDVIKESLADSMGNVERGDTLGSAAIKVMFALSAQPGSVILDSFFWAGAAEHDLGLIPKIKVQIHCECSPDVAMVRQLLRVQSGERHDVHHLPTEEQWGDWTCHQELELDCPRLVVNTEEPVHLDSIVDFIRHNVGDDSTSDITP